MLVEMKFDGDRSNLGGFCCLIAETSRSPEFKSVFIMFENVSGDNKRESEQDDSDRFIELISD